MPTSPDQTNPETVVFAVLVVDAQEDFLNVPSLVPSKSVVVSSIAGLLDTARQAGVPVIHVQSLVSRDGSDAMPHRAEAPRCVEGTPGAKAPTPLVPRAHETLLAKRFFSAFDAKSLDGELIRRGVTDIVLAGAYTHACVRETALDAYARGYRVHILKDAVCSDQPQHAEHTLDWISSRGAMVIEMNDAQALFRSAAKLDGVSPAQRVTDQLVTMQEAQNCWAQLSLDARIAEVSRWAEVLETESESLTSMLAEEIHKPVRFARDEVRRAIAHIRTATDLRITAVLQPEQVSEKVRVTLEPIGIVAAIMPWNNPLALPIGNIAPALIAGNAVILKGSPFAPRVTRAILDTLRRTEIPADLVQSIVGGSRVAAQLAHHELVAAVTLTGSVEAGEALAEVCGQHLKPLRAELGGNNAAIVLPDAHLADTVPALLNNAFSFAGQRCTAVRRFIVFREILDDFVELALQSIAFVRVGDSQDETTVCGPLISKESTARVLSQLAHGVEQGASVLFGGDLFSSAGATGVAPTLVLATEPSNSLVQIETFGPVAVIQVADSLDHAIDLANAVQQGLVVQICTTDPARSAAIAQRVLVGLVQHGPDSVPIHAEAPFAGWKQSSFGGPEHGRWDYAFFTRPKVHYGR